MPCVSISRLFAFSLLLPMWSLAQSFPVASWQTETADQMPQVQSEINELVAQNAKDANNLAKLLKHRTTDALRGPYVWCAPMRNHTQTCTYRIERLQDDSIQGIVEKLKFEQVDGKWKLVLLHNAWRCAAGRGRSNAYHNQTCR